MTDYNSRRISEAELTVLEVLWEAGEPLPAKTVQDILKETRNWERTTVRSLLTRLADKGTALVDKTDVALYSPAFTREEYGWDLAEVLISRLYDGEAAHLLEALCAHGCLRREELTTRAEAMK